MELLESIKMVFIFIKNWSDVILIGVGSFALLIYFFQKRDQRINAATELKEQIIDIEEKLQTFRNRPFDLTNINLYSLGPILTENCWNRNRLILSRYLSESDRKLIQTFYTSVEKIERARGDAVKCLADTWNHKSFYEQKYIGMYHMKELKYDNNDFTAQINTYLKDTNVFTPDICISILKTAKNILPLTGTTTYQKISKLSNSKEK